MGIGVTVHGYIEFSRYGEKEHAQATLRHNQRVIESLPESDPLPPFITRSMFSCLPLREELDLGIPQYDRLLIMFAGNYKDMYMLTPAWIAKFESLLSRLIWDEASVFVEFCGYGYLSRALFRALACWFVLALIGPPLVVALARASGSLPSPPALKERVEGHGPWHHSQLWCRHMNDVSGRSLPEHQDCKRKALWLSRLERGYHAVQLSLPILGGVGLGHFVNAAIRGRTLKVALPGVLILLVGIGGFVLHAYYVAWVF